MLRSRARSMLLSPARFSARLSARLSKPGELQASLTGLLALCPVSLRADLGVLWPTLSASKSMLFPSNASRTLQNKPPYFCRGIWSAVPGLARYTGRSFSSAMSRFALRSAIARAASRATGDGQVRSWRLRERDSECARASAEVAPHCLLYRQCWEGYF
ncbi:hypothetical protein NL108_000231 [Boleophthalmus pectinirostris]|nr:hypothetical protein NL108_000231 [Boleophthalmus pectinirostris]